jgi:hypothetical protein
MHNMNNMCNMHNMQHVVEVEHDPFIIFHFQVVPKLEKRENRLSIELEYAQYAKQNVQTICN